MIRSVIARQAQAFGVARAVGQQRTRGQQIGVDPGQRFAGEFGGARVVRGQRGEGMETGVDQGDRQRA